MNHEMYLQRVLKSTLCAFDEKQNYINNIENKPWNSNKFYTHSAKIYKNSTDQVSNLLFLENPSKHSWQSSPSI